MNTTSAIGLGLAAILACSAAYAETDEAKPLHPFQLQKLQAELKLSDQQKEEVGKIFEETRPQLEALRQQMLELREKMRTRLKTVLTTEQMAKFDQLRQERRAQRRQGRAGRGD